MMNKIKKCRLDAGFAQKYIAKQIGVSNQTVSYWETGQRTPSADNYKQLADIFGVSVGYLMGLEDQAEQTEQIEPKSRPVQASAQIGDVFVTTVPQIAMMGREMEKMTPEQRDQMLAVGKALFKEYFGKDAEDET